MELGEGLIREGLNRLKKMAKSTIGGLDTWPPELEFDQINPGTIADIIYRQLGNPAGARFSSDRWMVSFNAYTVFRNLTFKDNKFMPKENHLGIILNRIEDQLGALVGAGALRRVEQAENEKRQRYKVVEEAKLKGIADGIDKSWDKAS